MKIPNIDKSKMTFVVNKEKRTVCCYIDSSYADRYSQAVRNGILENKISPYDDMDYYSFTRFCLKGKPKTVSATAKCSPDDEWNEDIGKRVASLKLQNKILKAVNRAAKELFKEYCKKTSEMLSIGFLTSMKISENRSKIHEG